MEFLNQKMRLFLKNIMSIEHLYTNRLDPVCSEESFSMKGLERIAILRLGTKEVGEE